MSRRVDTSDELSRLIDLNEALIKAEYYTIKLFVDSAIRAKLRGIGVKVPTDEVVAHSKKVQANKRLRYQRNEELRKRKRALHRINVQKHKLNKKLGADHDKEIK